MKAIYFNLIKPLFTDNSYVPGSLLNIKGEEKKQQFYSYEYNIIVITS